jgi:hypothetical protein
VWQWLRTESTLQIVLSTGLVAGTRIGNEQRRSGFPSLAESVEIR